MWNVPRFTYTNVVRNWPKMPVEETGQAGDVHHVTANLCYGHSVVFDIILITFESEK